MMTRGSVAGIAILAAAALGLVARLDAEPGVVITKDGREIRGDVVESANDVKVTDKEGTRVFPRESVREIRKQPGVDELYRQRASAIRDDDAEGHYRLAEWCREQGRYDLALRQATKVLAINPRHENASLLRKLAERRLREAKGSATREAVRAAVDLLTDADIQRLRWTELVGPGRVDVDAVRVEFAKGFVDAFLREYSDQFPRKADRERFLKARSPEQFRTVVAVSGGPDEARQRHAANIRIVDDPFVFSEFRRVVLPVVTKGCGSAECHGGGTTKGFRLVADRLQANRALYTNFFILDAATDKGGQYRVIDRDRPDRSLLLQYGLPPGAAPMTHPAAAPIKPVFRSPAEPAYRAIRGWMSLLRIPHPGYDISLQGVGDAGRGMRPAAGQDR